MEPAYKKYVANKKNDYSRINGFLEKLEENGLDEPKKQYIQFIRNILEIMKHDDAELLEKKTKNPKFAVGFMPQ